MKKNQGWIKSPPNNTNAFNIGVVGFGRSGSTLVTNMLKDFAEQAKEKYNFEVVVTPEHWYSASFVEKHHIFIMCRRDLRDVLASGFRNTTNGIDNKFLIERHDEPYPEDFKVYKEKYGIPEKEIIEYGNKHLNQGWYDWLPHVNYIFHYEEYMKNKEKIAKELSVAITGNHNRCLDLQRAIRVTEEWKKDNPQHLSPSKGKSNAWGDIFSSAQEKVILDNFGGWMREYDYIK